MVARTAKKKARGEGRSRGLRARVGRDPLFGVGVWDVLSAKLAERAGFDLVFLSGYGLAGTMLGEPDVGLLTQTEIVEAARRQVRGTRGPVVVDGDTGHGGPLNVQRLVRELTEIGARGVLLEDQVWPKRCGHMAGKEVISAEEHVQKIRAAIDARGEADFVVVARTDARAPLGLDEAIRRGRLYREAGADVVFVEAPESRDELARIGREVPGPLLANMVEGGRTPILPLEELRALGFGMVVYPLTGLFASARAIEQAFTALAVSGKAPEDPSARMGFGEFTALVGLQERSATAERFRS